MCGRFTMVMPDELEGIARAIECCAPYVVDADWPAQALDALPGSEVSVLRLADVTGGSASRPAAALSNGEAVGVRRTALKETASVGAVAPLSIASLIWGFDLPGQGKTVFNTRSETAAASSFWRESFLRRRCVVPVHAFFEPHRSERAVRPDGVVCRAGTKTVKQTYRFADEDGGLLLLAGIWSADRFSILTTQPDEVVAPVHDRMPVILGFENTLGWLTGACALEDADPCIHVALSAEPLYEPVPVIEQQQLF